MRSRALSEPVLLILLTVSGGPRHGYAIMKHVEEVSGGRVVPSTGTTYAALHRLPKRWIDSVKLTANTRGKRAYRITAIGRRMARAEVARLRLLIDIADEHSV